jgi:signal transduction histidine kinase
MLDRPTVAERLAMRFLSATSKSGWNWWWSFAVLLGLPALLLAWLGLRAAHADRVEREQQFREQQTQVARLINAAMINLLAKLESDLRRWDADQPITAAELQQQFDALSLFSVNDGGLIRFIQDRIYFTTTAEVMPATDAIDEWPVQTEQAIEQVRAAEAQGHKSEAATAYRQIMNTESKLRAWAEIGLARLQDQSGNLDARRLLANAAWGRSEAVTPAGLPAALIACAYVERVAERERAAFIPLLEQTLASLRRGQWWLSYDARRFYDAELRRLLEGAGSTARSSDDAHLDELADMATVIGQALPRRETTTYGYEPGRRAAYLIIWSASVRDAGQRLGLAIAPPQLAKLLDVALAQAVSGLSFTTSIRDGQSQPLWGTPSEAFHTEALPAVSGWEIVFSRSMSMRSIEQKQWFWYGLILLLIVVLAAGLMMTARVVRREMELNRLQNEFIAAVSHEFKSPLVSIRLLMERLTGGRVSTSEAINEYHAAINREAQRLERLVHRLLEVQQIAARRKRYHFARTSLIDIAEAAIHELRPQAEAREIHIEAQTAGEIPELSLDRAAMTDALENLIDNAIKYSPSGARVTVEIRATENHVCVEVCDQGIGIDRDELPRIFDKFYRGRRAERQDAKGAGLGLAIVKAAVEAHGGSIHVDSAPGRGSRFSLRLSMINGGSHYGAHSDR